MESARSMYILMILAVAFEVAIIEISEAAQATEHIYIDYVICKFNPKYTTNATCKLNFITRLKKAFTFNVFVTKEIPVAISHIQLYYKFRNGYQLFLINIKMNACDYLNDKGPSKILDYLVPAMTKYANRNITCPFSGWYHIEQMPVNGEMFDNAFLPVGNYLFNFTNYNGRNELAYNAQFYFIIPEGKTIEDDRMGR